MQLTKITTFLFVMFLSNILFAQEINFTLEVLELHEGPVIKKSDPGTEDNKYGFEGGRVIRYKDNYHMFTAERFGDPQLVKMRLGHWKSKDGLQWERLSTIFESSGNFTGEDNYASFWAPMPYFNEDENRWNLFFVTYRSKPNDPTGWYLNYEGRIVRAVSEVPGYDGLAGPYQKDGIVLEPGPDDGPWEGLQGTDSFYAYQVHDKWYALYGSAQTQRTGINENYPKWTVTLASAPKLAGPWKKLTEHGIVKFHERFAENPVITKLNSKDIYVAMLDGGRAIGYSFSQDGINWHEARFLPFDIHIKDRWWTHMRTPLGLIPEDDGSFTVFFTAYTEPNQINEDGEIFNYGGFAAVGMVKLKLSDNNP
jgi:hypothetical protein